MKFYPLSIEWIVKKAAGGEGITSYVVKQISSEIVDVFQFICNFSLTTGEFPAGMKKAVVIPLFKKGDRRKLENYRPISLLPIYAKIFEKCIKTRLVCFLNKHNFYSDNQFGFREGRGTENALLRLVGDVYGSVDDSL